MIEAILEIFTSAEKAEIILSNPLIKFIFIFLLVAFVITMFIHLVLYRKFRKIRNYLHDTKRMDIEPLQAFKEQFEKRQQLEAVKAETFVQERFSGWRMFGMPVINLIKLVQMTVSVFILVGVLGTFIGLTVSLGGIDIASEQLVENVASVLAGIDMAFYTSIAGMGLSLIMTVLIKLLNTEYLLTDIMLQMESSLEGNEQNGINRLIEISETMNHSILGLQETHQQSLNEIVQAFSGFRAYTTGLQQSAEDLAKFNDGLAANLEDFHGLFHSMKLVTDGFGAATTKLNNQFDTLFTYFKKVDSKNERMVSTFESTYEQVKEVTQAQIDTLKDMEHIVGGLKDFTTSILKEQESIQTTFQKVLHKSGDFVTQMEGHNQAFKQIFGEDVSSKLTGLMSYLGELSRDFDKLGHSIVGLPQALEVINRTQEDYKHLLSDRFVELKEFNRTFGNHLKAHATESAAFEKKMYDASSTYEQLGMKNNQLIQGIHAIVTQMHQTFHHRENQLEANVDILKDTLAKYVSSLEGTLGNKLEMVIRNIADSVDRTNAGIKTEFQELRRISEETQQASARYTQNILRELGQEIHLLNRQLNAVGQQAVKINTLPGLRQNEY